DRDRDDLLALLEIEPLKTAANRRTELLRLYFSTVCQLRIQHLHIVDWQHVRSRDRNGVAAHLDRELRGADHRGSNTLGSGLESSRQRVARDAGTQCCREPGRQIAEV